MVVAANNEGENMKSTPCCSTKGGFYSKLGNIQNIPKKRAKLTWEKYNSLHS